MRICAPGKTAFTLEQTHVLIVCLRVVLISILLLGTSHSALRVKIVPEKISIKKSPLPKAKAIKIVRKNRSREIRPLNIAELPFYSFASVDRAFGRVDISRIPEFTGNEFEYLVLGGTPLVYRDNLKKYLRKAMATAMKYQVDPFWVLSVMWIESHFKLSARSIVDARGLMQIMPATGAYLALKMKIPTRNKKIEKVLADPAVNIEMGVYYLRYLLEYFNGDYVLATVAYNMGPGGVKRRLRRGLDVGVRNLYLTKIRRVYRFLTRDYINTITHMPVPMLVSMKEEMPRVVQR
ncbi:MAG: lytic transglycosylase domain-containing protein [Bacteriovoracaceae bacterium]|nr:lytic transglycosylase domain-containing protein [Bacteriovoracaceae bacterium]